MNFFTNCNWEKIFQIMPQWHKTKKKSTKQYMANASFGQIIIICMDFTESTETVELVNRTNSNTFTFFIIFKPQQKDYSNITKT